MAETRLLVVVFVPVALLLTYVAWSRSQAFGISFVLLVIYTVFTQIAYAWYPQALYMVYPHEPFPENVFWMYWAYVVSALCLIALFSKPLYRVRPKLEIVRQSVPTSVRGLMELLHHLSMAVYSSILAYLLWRNYGGLSYQSQFILKNNHLWFWLFELSGLVMLSLWTRVIGGKSTLRKATGMAWLLIVTAVTLATAVRAGQRIEIVQGLLGFIGLVFSLHGYQHRRAFLAAGSIALPSLVLMQGIRALRRSQIDFGTFLTFLPEMSQRFLAALSLELLVFQDYTVPSMTLMYSIAHGVVMPGQVMLNNLANLAVLVDYPTLGAILSRMLDPDSATGYGYYLLTEGYNVAGMVGIFYAAVVFVVGIWGLERVIANAQDTLLRSYVQGVVAFLALGFVRGQSFWFVKSIYMELLPALVLFMLAHGEVLRLTKKQKHAECSKGKRERHV